MGAVRTSGVKAAATSWLAGLPPRCLERFLWELELGSWELTLLRRAAVVDAVLAVGRHAPLGLGLSLGRGRSTEIARMPEVGRLLGLDVGGRRRHDLVVFGVLHVVDRFQQQRVRDLPVG